MMVMLSFTSIFKQVSGKVTGEGSKDGLPGATVVIKGTQVGSVTDVDGISQSQSSPTDTLVVSFWDIYTEYVGGGTIVLSPM